MYGESTMSEKKRVQVVFTDKQWQIISGLRGDFGDGDSEIVRNVVLAWLAEKSVISTNLKNRLAENNKNHIEE